MNTKLAIIGLATAVLIGGAAYFTYRISENEGMVPASVVPPETMAPDSGMLEDPSTWSVAQGENATRRHIEAGIHAGDVDPQTGRQVLHYYDPMMPGNKFETPGKSPYMDMMLIPAYAESAAAADSSTVAVSARMQQNMGIRIAEVTEGIFAPVVNAVGTIVWNEREQSVLQARAQGFVEKLYVRAALDPVSSGQALADLYVPEWIAAQEEFLALTRVGSNDVADLVAAAKSRMRQAGMTDEQIATVERLGEVQGLVTVRAPQAGIVSELGIREGMTVMPGMTLFQINGTATVWAEAEVPESQAALLRVGDSVVAQTPSVPNATFEGNIEALLPGVSAQLRTRKARLELANADALLFPGMLLQMTISTSGQEQALLLPTEAVIDTGNRTIVMVEEGTGEYRPVTVTTGAESNGQTVITSGLQAGQRVVLSGQFLLDSEASLRGLETRLAPAGEQP